MYFLYLAASLLGPKVLLVSGSFQKAWVSEKSVFPFLGILSLKFNTFTPVSYLSAILPSRRVVLPPGSNSTSFCPFFFLSTWSCFYSNSRR